MAVVFISSINLNRHAHGMCDVKSDYMASWVRKKEKIACPFPENTFTSMREFSELM